MIIVIDGSSTGFSNNGGTLTNFRSADTLAALGHEVYCLAETNNFNWFKLKKARFVTTRPPKADVTIATGWRSAINVMKEGKGKRLWWVRGWEIWSCAPAKWESLLKEFPNIIVNSNGLKKRVNIKTGRDCKVIFPGVDNDLFYPEPLINSAYPFTVGALYNKSKATKQMALTKSIIKRLHKKSIKTRLIGASAPKNIPWSKYIVNPTLEKKRRFFNKCSVWLSVSISEGMHMPPIEAGLCGCALVCTAALYGGTSDYAINGDTAIVLGGDAHCKNPNKYVKVIEMLKENHELTKSLGNNLRNTLLNKIGNREENMKKLIKIMEEL